MLNLIKGLCVHCERLVKLGQELKPLSKLSRYEVIFIMSKLAWKK